MRARPARQGGRAGPSQYNAGPRLWAQPGAGAAPRPLLLHHLLLSRPRPRPPPPFPPPQVVRALHRCFLYDTGAAGAGRFLDEPRFQRLLPPLVAHLGLQPPPAVAPALEADGTAGGGGRRGGGR